MRNPPMRSMTDRRTAMFAPIGMTSAAVESMSIGLSPLSGIARTPYNARDIHTGGGVSQIGSTRPATKSTPDRSSAATRRASHRRSGRTSSSVNASVSPHDTASAAFTACDFPGVDTDRYLMTGRPAAAAASTTERVLSIEPLSATTISNRLDGQVCRDNASSVCASSALRLRVATMTEAQHIIVFIYGFGTIFVSLVGP